jgi:hypothetical protein
MPVGSARLKLIFGDHLLLLHSLFRPVGKPLKRQQQLRTHCSRIRMDSS